MIQLKDICDIYDCPHTTAKDEGKGYPLVRTPNVGKGRLILDGIHRVSEDVYNSRNARAIPEEGDLILAREAPVGNVSIIMDGQRVCLGQRVVLIKPKRELVDPHFLTYYLLSAEVQHRLKNHANGAVVAHLNVSDIRNLWVTLPELEEQVAIGKILRSIDDKIELNRQINDNLEQQAQALYKSWFVDFEPFKDGKFIDSELGIIPEGWKILPLSSLGSIICGKTPSKSNKDFYDGNIPFIKIPDMHNKIFVSNSEDHLSDLGMNSQRNKTIPPYSILVSCIATVGLVCINTKVCQTNQQINTLIPYEDSYRIYLFLFLKSLREQLITLGSGGTTTLNVNTSQFSNLKIIVPDTKSLKAFSSIAESLFQRINNNCDTNYMLSNLRDMILPKLMSGELKINDLDC